jgi:predicted nuclease of predicted toxin-antitoxin system
MSRSGRREPLEVPSRRAHRQSHRAGVEAEGHDVVRAALDYATWTDPDLLALAVSEERIIVTEDSDFSDLIYAAGMPPPPAIIYIRCEPEMQPTMAGRIIDALASGRLNGHMAVVRPSSSRYRPLPAGIASND